MTKPRRKFGKRLTIYDLAKLAGVSPTAVSSVLNGTWKKRRISANLAERIKHLADENGYALNMQASGLRRDNSRLIGMIVPKYDNRYFGSIVEKFESMARDRGLFPIITCTQRNPELEVQAARAMISHQVDCLIATGATDPDRITKICSKAGVRSLNLDLPGKLTSSVISDNFHGAFELTKRILSASAGTRQPDEPLLYIGGRTDHNTLERIKGFSKAHEEAGIQVDNNLILATGYAPEKAQIALEELAATRGKLPSAMFVNSTISLEGVMRWIKTTGHYGKNIPHIGCFDWDPLVSVFNENILMVRQDVSTMLQTLFQLIDKGTESPQLIKIPTIFDSSK